MKKLLLVHKDRNKLQKDGWRYGDYVQYVGFFEDNSAICLRTSGLPATLAVAGFIVLTLAGAGVMTAVIGVPVYWNRIIFTAIVGVLLPVPWLITWYTPWRLMVPVSGKMFPREDGSYYRDI